MGIQKVIVMKTDLPSLVIKANDPAQAVMMKL
jgi:hypothetical protein